MNMEKTKAEMDEAIAVFAGALTQKNCIKWLKLSRHTQERVMYNAFKDGIFTYKFPTRSDHEKFH